MNPATRLLTLFDALPRNRNTNKTMEALWAELFALDPNTPHLEDDVTTCVIALRQQVDFVRMRLSEHGVPPQLLSPGFERLKDVASTGKIHSSWSGYHDSVRAAECRHAFAWAAWVLRDEDETDMSVEDVTALRAEIESLEQSLEETEMSPYLRDFIQRQVDTIRNALRLYGVQGARPLQDALQKVAGSYTVERNRVENEHAQAPEAARGVLAKTGAFIKKTAEVCDSLNKIKEFGEGILPMAAAVGPLVLSYMSK